MSKETINDWATKLISPGTLFSIIMTASICYGTIQVVSNQQQNDGKRIDQIERSANINRIDISKNTSKISKIDGLIDNINLSMSISNKLQADLVKELRTIVSIVAVLRDRDSREYRREMAPAILDNMWNDNSEFESFNIRRGDPGYEGVGYDYVFKC